MLFMLRKVIVNGRRTMRQQQLINKYLEGAINRYTQIAGTCDTKCSQ